jgi:hypothetical protein
LVEVSRLVLDNLHGYDLLRLEVLAFDDLSEGALTQNIQDQIAIPVAVHQYYHGIEPSPVEPYLCPLSSLPRISFT